MTNQSMIYEAAPEARSRLAGGYMVFYAIGTGAGSIASTATYAWAGWTGLGAATSAAALSFWAATLPRGAAEANVTGRDPRSAPVCAS